MQDKNSIVNSVTSDDLDFNIEEVEQVIAPQIDTGGDDTDTKIGDEEPSAAGVTNSRKKWCC